MAYSDGTKAAAIMRLAATGNDYKQVANEIGVSVRTLGRWAQGENVNKKEVEELLENALGQLLSHVPSKMTGRDWGIAVGILMDKWLLMRGEPTQRTERVSVDQRTQDDLNDVLREADRILEAAARDGCEAIQQEAGAP